MELIDKLLDEKVDLFERNGLIFTDFKALSKDDMVPFIDEVIENMDKFHVSILHSIKIQFGNDVYTMFGIKGAEYNKEQEEELKEKLTIIGDKVKDILLND